MSKKFGLPEAPVIRYIPFENGGSGAPIYTTFNPNTPTSNYPIDVTNPDVIPFNQLPTVIQNQIIRNMQGNCNCVHGTPMIDTSGNCVCRDNVEQPEPTVPVKVPVITGTKTDGTPVIYYQVPTTGASISETLTNTIKENPLMVLGGAAVLAYLIFGKK